MFLRAKEKFLKGVSDNEADFPEELEDDYVEIDTDVAKGKRAKITVRPFAINDFEDMKPVLDSLREGTTVALLNIKPLKDKDIVELKRAINKLKKTCDAIDGDIAGFGDDWVVVTPSFANIYRNTQTEDVEE